ncbi:DUF3006 domain-containing protein [Butyricicoccus pullicaecorum]|uniref:DUF3006 domain-containing protein n=2 Tax=Butyricicoccus pullicaecorum TaxID=501571 RepID=R8W1S6_9FIRM|nr:DUF3006 domain-containing protein [Butyricicoccus pullicaecorum]EOQ38456.1 hypothetical protein HMPREF1526_01489 [Butyricicoccus pullicaecorum 1.2]MDY2968487.1 DUF3006 domain-containing protein [Butyricicoccus pullicaecorum]OUP52844.1 hypothetical protein B5F17_07620 [Butyricicoccus pullicaecorum]OUP57420.1 hypothetical protein B5F15_09945 [Butyricicoccus pullicaecorum]SKA53751.1 Protein of unknown function [Butyricicoccus pullicaecorum DSM 23266]
MREQAVVDRFEGDFIILETDHGMIEIPRSHAPVMAGEGMVVWYEGDRILEIDEEETARREAMTRRRFERILGKK